MEEWAKAQPAVKGRGSAKSRTAWNNPTDVAAQSRYGVISRVFQPTNRSKTRSSGVPQTRSAIGYQLHPWIEAVTAGEKSDWRPNPECIQFFHKDDDTLITLAASENPSLRYGDLHKLVFKIGVGVSPATWSMSFIPVQMIRTIDGDGYISGRYGGVIVEEDTSTRVLKAGATLTPVRHKCLAIIKLETANSVPGNRVRVDHNEAAGEEKLDKVKREKHRSPSWAPLTPESGSGGSVPQGDHDSRAPSEAPSYVRSSATPEGG